MEPREMWAELRRYWRIPVVALLGALLAFGLSYAVPTEYESTSTMLIRSSENSYQSSTGGVREATRLTGGIVDLTTGLTVGQTNVELAQSRTVAEQVVDELGLDQVEEEETGPIGTVLKGLVGAFNRTVAFISYGFYEEPPEREKAIREVQQNLTAEVQQNSWVMRVKYHGSSPEEAQLIAATAADVIQAESQARFSEGAAGYRESLEQELDRAADDVSTAAAALADYKNDNGLVTPNDPTGSVEATTAQQAPQRIQEIDIELAANRAELEALNASLAETPQQTSTSNQIVTGRSSTDVTTSTPNPTYQQLVAQIETLESTIAGQEAERDRLAAILDDTTVAEINDQQIELARLQTELDAQEAAYSAVLSQYTSAVFLEEIPRFDLSIQDEANLPTYPASPLRYLYLILGLFIGALAGGFLTWMHSHRPLQVDELEEEGVATATVDYRPPVEETASIDLTRLKTLSEQGSTRPTDGGNGGGGAPGGNGPGA